VRRPLAAGQIMSRPARFVTPGATVSEAMVLCQRHRQSGILVGDPRGLLGAVTREDLDGAIGHGLSHAPVKGVMHGDLVTCGPETALAEVQRLLAGTDAGRIPVVADGEVVGDVTRTDVLRALEEPVGELPPTLADVGERLLALPGLEPVFQAIQAVGEGYDGVYLV